MDLKYIFVGLLYYLYYQINHCSTESITYISTERPEVSWINTKYCKNFTIISRRHSRQDPKHYVELYFHSLFRMDNNMKLSFYFYQFLTNRYRPSFIEMHFKLCDMINSDPIFGETIRRALGNYTCPLAPGEYTLKNLSIPFVPKGFPFPKGRIYLNASYTEGGVTHPLGRGSIDMEVKVAKINKKQGKNHL